MNEHVAISGVGQDDPHPPEPLWPEKVRIGWLDHIIRPFGPQEAHEKDVRGQYVSGAHLNEIRYDAEAIPARQAHTIIHEILHGIRECCLPFGFINSLRSMESICDTEEMFVSGYGDGLAMIIRDNPELFLKLQKALTQ